MHLKNISTHVEKLFRIHDYYRVQINNSSGNQVFVTRNDYFHMLDLISQLHSEIHEFNPTISNELNDIHQNLFINKGFITINPYRFGVLGFILKYLRSYEFICESASYIRTPWTDVNDAIKKLLSDANNVGNRLDYNQVGVAAREIYILLAKKVYSEKVRQNSIGKNISNADAKGMLDAFFEFRSTDNDVRRYAKEAIKLADPLTHTKTENQEKMKTLLIAVIALAGIVTAVYQS